MLREHLDLELEIERLVAKRTEVNAEIRPKAKRSAELVHQLDDDTILRDVRCTVHELASNEVVVMRTDTGEEVERRTMTAAERQGEWDWSGATEAAVERAREAVAEQADDPEHADVAPELEPELDAMHTNGAAARKPPKRKPGKSKSTTITKQARARA